MAPVAVTTRPFVCEEPPTPPKKDRLMCLACEMEAMWFAAMEARLPQRQAVPQADCPALSRCREGGRGSGRGKLLAATQQAPSPNPPPEAGGGGTAPPRFACEETQAE